MLNKFPVFDIQTDSDFEEIALDLYRFQSRHNKVYRQFTEYLKIDTRKVNRLKDIPFLPVEFFKTRQVVSSSPPYDTVFMSSGTTGMQRSRHYIKDLKLYEKSFLKSFQYFYGDIKQYTVLALLPSYVEQGHSSLVYMVDMLIKKSGKPLSGFYLNDAKLPVIISEADKQGNPVLLIGVSYALLDLIQNHRFELKHTIVMETGGMKGRRKEMIREELHTYLKKGFGVDTIHSEYGMTELLSQSYSKSGGIFQSPPWQKILIRDTEDPLSYLSYGKTGGVNIIDLTNVHSCAFIATQDLGKLHNSHQFEILGRFDHSDVRGCNLLVI